MDQWREWLRLWKMRVSTLRCLIARRTVASTLRRWHLLSSGSKDRRTLLQAVVGRQLEEMLVRKCLLALAQHALSSTTLRRLITTFRIRTLRGGFEAWRQALPREKHKTQPPPPPSPAAAATVITGRRRQPGNPRKHHCRCVYAVSRGQRCTCAPRSHLLRRVEELHRLVAQGLDGRQGGYRLLSHVVQRTTTAPSGDARLDVGDRNSPSFLESSSRGRNGPAGTRRAAFRKEGRDKDLKERVRPGSGQFYKRSRDRGLPAAATGAAAITSCQAAEEGLVRLEAHRTPSLAEEVDAIDSVALAVSGGQRCDPAVRPQSVLSFCRCTVVKSSRQCHVPAIVLVFPALPSVL